MQKNGARILNTNICNLQIDFNLKESKLIDMEIQIEASIMSPAESKEKNAMLSFKTKVTSKDNDDIFINAVAELLFEFEEIPDDYQQVAKDICIPMAHKDIFFRIDNILENMGHSGLKLSDDE